MLIKRRFIAYTIVVIILLLLVTSVVVLNSTVQAMVPESAGPQLVAQQDLMDFGDALDPSYPTLLQNGGAHHRIGSTQFTLYLGNGVDAEPDGQPDPTALGDDNNGDDEDGVTFPGPLVRCEPGEAKVTVFKSGGPNAYLNAWIDFNADGSWVGEQVATDLNVGSGIHTLTFQVPCDAVPGQTVARFRISSESGVTYENPPGSSVPDGEVEDHAVTISEAQADLGVSITDIPDPVVAGEKLDYTVSVANNGPDTADVVTVTIDFDVMAQFVAPAVPSQGVCDDGPDPVTCELGQLDPGNDAQVHLESHVISGAVGIISTTASVTSTLKDPAPSNNGAAAVTSVIWRSEARDYGDLPASYHGLNEPARHLAHGLMLGNSLDAEWLHLESAGADGDDRTNLDDEDGVVFLTPLKPGQQASVQISGPSAGYVSGWVDFDGSGRFEPWYGEEIIGQSFFGGGSQVFSFTVPAGAITTALGFSRFRYSNDSSSVRWPDNVSWDPVTEGEVEDHLVWIGTDESKVDLSVKKYDLYDPSTPNDRLVYTLAISNVGYMTATGASILDDLSADVEFAEIIEEPVGAACAYNERPTHTITCPSLPDLAFGERLDISFAVTVTKQVSAGERATIFNTASVQSDGIEPDPDLHPNTATEPTSIVGLHWADKVLTVDVSASMGGWFVDHVMTNIEAARQAGISLVEMLEFETPPPPAGQNTMRA